MINTTQLLLLSLACVLVAGTGLILKSRIYPALSARHYLRDPSRFAETSLQLIFDHVRTAYILIGPDLHVLTFNPMAQHITSSLFHKQLRRGSYSIDYFFNSRKEIMEIMFRDALRGKESAYETEYTQEDGSQVWYEVRIQPVMQNEKPVAALMSGRDITEKKLMELQREKITAELEQHTRNLEQFAYIVSHNIRAPLANIIGLSSVLRLPEVTAEQREDFIDSIAYSARKLDEVIIDLNGILHVRNSMAEEQQQVELCHVLADVKQALNGLVPGLNVQVNSDFSAVNRIFSVKSYLYSIFYNLISNSIKYRQPGTDPIIHIASRQYHDSTEIIFSDNGMGIDMERNGDKVFGLYKRFHPQVEGKGLGLYMTRTQVEKLGGSICIDSAPGKGTEFKIRFI